MKQQDVGDNINMHGSVLRSRLRLVMIHSKVGSKCGDEDKKKKEE